MQALDTFRRLDLPRFDTLQPRYNLYKRAEVEAGVQETCLASNWWEGDILVVEPTNFDPRTGIGSPTGGYTYGLRTKVVERFTRTARDRILYGFTVQDPDYLTQPFRGEMPMRAAPGPSYGYAGHAGN